jgi:hypothetical protein
MCLPDITNYKDLHAGMSLPKLSHQNLTTYLGTFEKDIDKIATDLYSGGFINYVRLCTNDVYYYIRAECRASMKVAVTYIVDVSIDSHGIVQECQCECAAGMGPHAHCKHVVALLYGLVKFSDGGQFQTAKTCTEKLQTFHHAKKHLGSPVKAEKLVLPISKEVDFDPRPRKFIRQTHYSDHFRNTCINSCIMYDSPISQCFPPANPLAVLVDHCYHTPEDPIETFLRRIKVTEITEDEVREIQSATVGQNNDLWHRERQKRLNSSKFGRICKRTDRTDPRALARSLLVKEDIRSKSVLHGRSYELIAIQSYEAHQGIATTPCGIFISQDYPFLAATPDRIVNDNLLLEVKCPYTAREMKISPQTVPYLHCKEGKLQLSQTHEYYYQVQGQMLCTGALAVDFVVYTLQDMQVIRVNKDDNFIVTMLNQLKQFFDLFFKPALIDKFIAKDYFNDVLCHCSK